MNKTTFKILTSIYCIAVVYEIAWFGSYLDTPSSIRWWMIPTVIVTGVIAALLVEKATYQ